jgi:hypothetical protein
MTTNAAAPWAHVGEPAQPLAGFGWDLPGLPPEQAAMLRSLELAERAEERERQERVAERREQSYNAMVAESISRAHAHGRPWDPTNPLEHYPTPAQRIDRAFAAMDMQANANLREAKREAAKVLQSYGVGAQVTIDAGHPPSPPPGRLAAPPGDSEPPASRSVTDSVPGAAAHSYGLPRGPGEASYNRLRIARFFDRVGRKANR